jgi:excisionase family DNA binding protein
MRYGRQEVRAAYHEAGHAVVAMHSIELSSVGIERKIKRGVHIYKQERGWIRPVRGSKVSIEENVLIELAGPMAEKMCPFGPGRDYRMASMADMKEVEAGLNGILTDSERGEYLDQCRQKVKRMLKHHWPEVKGLAKALLKYKRLTGRQAERIAGEVLEKERGNHLGNRSTRKRLKSISKKPSTRSKQEILTPDEVAEFLRVSRRTINHLVSAEAIPFVRIGKTVVRFKRQAITKWLREQNTHKKGR